MKKSIEKPMNQNVNACLCISEKIMIISGIGKERMLHKTLMKKKFKFSFLRPNPTTASYKMKYLSL